VVAISRVRVDVAAADADRRRAEKARLLRGLGVSHGHEPDLRLEAELTTDALDERDRGW